MPNQVRTNILSDIDIAKRATLRSISSVAKDLGFDDDDIEQTVVEIGLRGDGDVVAELIAIGNIDKEGLDGENGGGGSAAGPARGECVGRRGDGKIDIEPIAPGFEKMG